ncbi:MAG: SpoIIE family protein phosphatase [Deltaproteobacteria bacterium]
MTEVLDLLGKYAESIDAYGKILERTLTPDDRARYLARLAYSLQKSGEYQTSKERLVEALAILGVGIRINFLGLAIYVARLRLLAAQIWTRLVGPQKNVERTRLVVDILMKLFNIFTIVDARSVPYLTYRLMEAAVRLGPSRELAVAHGKMAIGLAQLRKPPFAKAARHALRSVEIARQMGEHLVAGLSLEYAAAVHCWSARYREAIPFADSARETLSGLGEMWDLANAYIFAYIAHRALGQFDQAMTQAQALLELGERIQGLGTISNANQKIAEVLLWRGDAGKGEAHLSRSLTIAEERKLNLDRFQAHKIRGAARLRDGNWKEARAQFLSAIRLCEAPGTSFFSAYVSDAYLGYAEAVLKDTEYLAASGGLRGEEGRLVWGYLRASLGREKRLGGFLGQAHRTVGLWHWRAGNPKRSREFFLRSLEILRKQGRPIEVALTELEAGDALGDAFGEESIAFLRRARAAFEEQRLKPLVERCSRVLSRLGHGERVASSDASEKSRAALNELISVGRMLMSSHEPNELLERIVDSSVGLLGAERGFVFTREGAGEPVVFRLGKAADGQRIQESEANVSFGVIRRVDEGGQALAVSDTEQDESLRERRSVMAFQVRSVICTALVHASEKLGVLYLDSQVTKAIFGKPELELLESFAAQAAVALANAVQFKRIEEMNRDLDAKVLDRTRELESANLRLSASMDELRNTTLRLAEAKRETLEKEMDVARSIQKAMVPAPEPVDVGCARFLGLIEPASFCGGDFWTFVDLGERLLFFVGDVTGHGVGSAMLTGLARSCIDTLRLESGLEPNKLLKTLGEIIYSSSQGQMFMTAFVAEVDRASHLLSFAIAGHNPQYLLQEGGAQIRPLFGRSSRLGDRQGSFSLQQIEYVPGDKLVLWTDGVTECDGPESAQYGDRRFRRLLQSQGGLSPEALVAEVGRDLKLFAAGTPPADDITLVVAELR